MSADTQNHRSRSLSNSVHVLPGRNDKSRIYFDNRNFQYYKQNKSGNKKYLRCINYFTQLCRGRGICKVNNTDFRLTVQHTCILYNPLGANNDNRVAFINKLSERSTRERTDFLNIYDKESLRFPRAAETVTFLQALRIMLKARQRQQPPVPDTVIQWSDMIESVEWRHRYMNVIGNQSRFYQGRIDVNGIFCGLVFSNSDIITVMRNNSIQVSVVTINVFYKCLPNYPSDLRQMLTVHVIHDNMSFPIVYACLTQLTQTAYIGVMRFIASLELPYSDRPIQVITDFGIDLCNAVRKIFPNWKQVGCPFYFNQAVMRFVSYIGLTEKIRRNCSMKNIISLLLSLPYLPANELGNEDMEGFNITDGFTMIRAVAIDKEMYEDLHPLFNYVSNYWIDQIGPAGFSVYGFDHSIFNFVESFYASFLGYLGVHPPLWKFYDLLRGVENITRLELTRVLNGQRVRRRFNFSKKRNNYIVDRAFHYLQNGGNDTLVFLGKIGEIYEVFIYNNLYDDVYTDQLHRLQRVTNAMHENAIPPTVSTPLSPAIERHDQEEIPELCIICYNNETNISLRPCGHKFCSYCILRFFQEQIKMCPLCRIEILEFKSAIN